MKKIYLLGLYFCSTSLLFAQKLAPFFISAPDNVIGVVSSNQRKDLVDFFQAGKTASTPNLLKGKSILEKLTDDFADLKTSSSGRLQIKMLPVNDSTYIFATIHTVCGEMCDSRISFFNSLWQPLPVEQFINRELVYKTKNKQTETYTQLIFSAETTDLVVQKQTGSKSPEEKTDTTRLPAISLQWSNGKFLIR